MEVSLYEGRRHDPNRFVRLMSAVNFTFSMVVLFGWSAVADLISEPMEAAAGGSIGNFRPSFDDYPYVILWLLPLIGAVVSWFASSVGYSSLAKFVSAYPLLLILCSCGWFYYFSQYYA